MTTRAPLLVVLGAGLALAGCTEPAASAPSTASAPSSAPTTAAPTPSPEATTATTTTEATAKTAAKATAKATAKPACPVSAEKLLTVLRGSKVGGTLAPTKRLTNVECHSGYALAQTNPVEADRAVVVFRHSGGAWHAVNGGTADYCDGFVPKAIAARFDRC